MLPLLLLTPAAIDLKAGYYTLSELGTALRAEVRADRAEEVYALRLRSATPEQIFAALQATGRLDVQQGQGGWIIRRSERDRDEDRGAVNRYLSPLLGRYARIRTAAANQVLRLLNETTAVAEKELERQRRLDGEAREVGTLAYLCLSEQELPFASLALAAPLAGGGFGSLGKAFTFRIAQNPGWFVPPNAGGRIQVAPTTRSDLVSGAAAKIMLDPVAMRGTERILFNFGGEYAGRNIASKHLPLLMTWPLPPGPEEVLSRLEAPLYTERIAHTATALSRDAAGVEAAMPKDPVPVTDALLRVAEASDKNLVAYVSPLSNRMLPPVPRRSLREIVMAVNGGDFDGDFDRLVTRERCGRGFGDPAKVSNWPGLSVRQTGSVFTVRTETDFLDRMVDGPPAPPVLMMNLRWQCQKIPLSALVEHVGGLKLSAWSGSTFSSQYLGFTNPTSFYPLARAFAASPTLMERVMATAEGKRAEFPLDDWKPAVKRELEAGIVRAADKCDAIADLVDPLHTARIVRDGRFSRMVLRATRDAGRVEFRIFLPLSDGEGKTFWASWVKGVG